MKQTFAIGIGGAAGQGVATPGDIFAKIFSRTPARHWAAFISETYTSQLE